MVAHKASQVTVFSLIDVYFSVPSKPARQLESARRLERARLYFRCLGRRAFVGESASIRESASIFRVLKTYASISELGYIAPEAADYSQQRLIKRADREKKHNLLCCI